MARSTAGWKMPPPRMVSMTWPLSKNRENSLFVNMISDASRQSLSIRDDPPPSVQRFIRDTRDGPARGKKCELGSMVHI